jgi:hypothetical protein
VAPLIPRLVLATALAVAVASIALGPAAMAQDGSPIPVPTRGLTCSERFPAEGPAGVDLRLGCIVSELVGLYTASSRDEPPTLSAYVIGLAAGIAAAALAAALALRIVARRASRRLAPVLPSEWWVCPGCHSVNPMTASRCYACGSPPGVGPTMPTEMGSQRPTG